VECVDTPAVDAAALKEGVVTVTDDGTKITRAVSARMATCTTAPTRESATPVA
jgi:hypothetical protein